MNQRELFSLLLVSMFFSVLFASFVFGAAEPQGPDIINVSSVERGGNKSSPTSVQAQAGNVTALVIQHSRVTQAWQGYYGNVSGLITLDDGDNYTMYDWTLPNPSGEIYASNGTNVWWTNTYCMNVSGLRNSTGSLTNPNSVVYRNNGTQLERNYGINNSDQDGLNETFNLFFSGTLIVGPVTFTDTDGCSMARPYTNDTDSGSWQEVLLSDNESIIFTSILRDDALSFKAGSGPHTADFQMLVLENGHVGQEDIASTYYFYVELV